MQYVWVLECTRGPDGGVPCGYRYGANGSDFHLRRLARLTNAFSKKLENHMRMVALYAVRYNFVRIHKTLKVTPAMAAALSPILWSMGNVAALIDAAAPKLGKRGP